MGRRGARQGAVPAALAGRSEGCRRGLPGLLAQALALCSGASAELGMVLPGDAGWAAAQGGKVHAAGGLSSLHRTGRSHAVCTQLLPRGGKHPCHPRTLGKCPSLPPWLRAACAVVTAAPPLDGGPSWQSGAVTLVTPMRTLSPTRPHPQVPGVMERSFSGVSRVARGTGRRPHDTDMQCAHTLITRNTHADSIPSGACGTSRDLGRRERARGHCPRRREVRG